MHVAETTAAQGAAQSRLPRLFGAILRLRHHPVACGAVGAAGIAVVFVLDMSIPGVLLNGLYLLPLFFLALSMGWRRP